MMGKNTWGRLGIFAAACFCLAQPISAHAQEPKDMATIKHEHCEESNNLENTICMNRELQESDKRLNVVYKVLMQALVKPQALQTAQRAWIAFRDAECKFHNEAMQDGSGYNFSVDLCLTKLTEQRIAVLESVVPCNGCVLFKDQYYKQFSFPKRKRIPASGKS